MPLDVPDRPAPESGPVAPEPTEPKSPDSDTTASDTADFETTEPANTGSTVADSAPDRAVTVDAREPGAGWGEALGRYAELFGLCGLVLAQPILDSFATSPETFVFRRASTTDIVLFAVVVCFAVPSVLFAAEQALGAVSRQARTTGHRVALAGLLAVAGWQLVERHTTAGLPAHLIAGAALAAGGIVAYHHLAPVRTVLRALAPITVMVAGLWLFTGPVSEVAFATGPGTAAGIPVEDPVPILFLVFDELPTASLLDDDGSVDATVFPHLAALAGDATWYRNTTAVSPTTPEAVPAILTGRYPTALDLVPTSAAHPDNVFRALESTYEFNVWELLTQLCPPEQCPELGGARYQGLGPLLGDAVDLWSTYMNTPPPAEEEAFAIRQSDPEAPAKVLRFVDSLAGQDASPRLDFLHVALPHQPWRHLPGGARHDAPFLAEGLEGEHYAWADSFVAQAGRQRHLLQMQRTDELLGLILDRLRELGRYDETLVVVTADHGVAFTEGEPIRGLSEGNAAEVMWVPLFIKEPGQTDGVVDDRPVETVDILPTLAELVGMELPWAVDGHSALGDAATRDDARRFYPWGRNVVQPDPATGYATIDGEAGFRALLELPVTGGEPRDDLQLHRFGPWGSLVGTEVTELDVTGTSAGSVQMLDDKGNAVDRAHFDLPVGSEIIPTYLRGRVTTDDTGETDDTDDTGETDDTVAGETDLPEQVVVAVNGVVAGWGNLRAVEGELHFFVLAPQGLFATADNDIEVFAVAGGADEITGSDGPTEPVLRPLTLDWAP